MRRTTPYRALLIPVWILSSSFAAAQEGQPVVPAQAATVNFRELAARQALQPEAQEPPRAIHAPRRVPRNMPVPPDARPIREPLQGIPENSETAGAPQLPDPVVSGFQALGDNIQFIPPDTNGAVGPNHVMTALNSEVRIQNRSGGVVSTMSLNSFWAGTGATGVFDPRLLYDHISRRWIAAAVSGGPVSSILLGGSQSSDPTGLWNLYRYTADATNVTWADFPSLGFNPNWVVVTLNMFRNDNNNYTGGRIYVFTRTGLYAGGSLLGQVFSASANSFTLAPATSFDPSGPLYLVEEWNGNQSGRGYLRLSTVGGSIDAATFSEGVPGFVSVAFTWAWEAAIENSAPQLGSSLKIATNDARMGNCVQRLQSLWCAHTVFLPAGLPNRAAVQWWQFDPVSRAVQQFGRVDDQFAAIHYAFPSIAVNRVKDVLLGYATFSMSIYASGGYSFRYGNDPLNSLRTAKIAKPGEAKYYKTYGGTSNRWGDYSSTVVDPLDDTTLWSLQEYAWTPSAQDRWSTWWLRLFPGRIYFPLIRN